MRVYGAWDVEEAVEYAKTGEIAIHLHRIIGPTAPGCFKRDIAVGLPIAHVFGCDELQLRVIAKRCGVRVVVIDRPGTDRQHIDMCGAPLRKLLAEVGVNIDDHRRSEKQPSGDTDAPRT